jgi:3-deoxy-D-manno-octulosonate 8-phosphate phosphatase (KDO 8-P phosphatase)
MPIKLLILDVDGTLTDSTVYYGDGNIEMKGFNTKDGAILKPLKDLGIEVIILTGRESEATKRRAEELNAIPIQGVHDKLGVLKKLLDEKGLTQEQCAYIGDDVNDYPAMRICAFRACPVDAAIEIKEICDYVSDFAGGYGAVRDICEQLLKKEQKYESFLRIYGVMTDKKISQSKITAAG